MIRQATARRVRTRGWLPPLLIGACLSTSLPAMAQTGNICSFVPPPKPPQALWSDAEGWGKPEYFSTIRLADLDGDGRAELVGRGPEGIIVREFGPASRTWLPGRVSLPLSDAAGWNRPERYSTIRLADIDGDGRAELLARADDGPHAWKYDARADSWYETDPAPAREALTAPDETDELLADVNGDGSADRVVRSSGGIETWGFDPAADRFESLTTQVQGFPSFTGGQKVAYDYISSQLLNGAPGADIRSRYTDEALKGNWNGVYQSCLNGGTFKNPVSCPNGLSAAGAGVSTTDWSVVTTELGKEFSYVADVTDWFDKHENFLNELNDSHILSVLIVSGKIQFPSDGSKNNDSVAFNILSLILRVFQAIGGITGQPEVSFIAGMFSTASSAAASFSGENQNQPNILSTVVGLEDKLNTHFQNAVLANGCLATYYLQDLTLLESIGVPIAQGRYNWDETLDGKLLAVGRPAYELTLWQTLAPVVWEIDQLATTCYGDNNCDSRSELNDYPGQYYYLQQDDDSTGIYFFLKIKGAFVDQGEPFAPNKVPLDAIFQPPPKGFGFRVHDVLAGQDDYDNPNGWNFSGDRPDIDLKRAVGTAPPRANAPLAIAEVHTSVGRSSATNPVARIRVRFGPGADPTTFRAFLNGREITGKFLRPANSACLFTACNWSARVTSLDGLVAGRNELRVEARGQGAVRHNDSLVFAVEAPTGIAFGSVMQLDSLIVNINRLDRD